MKLGSKLSIALVVLAVGGTPAKGRDTRIYGQGIGSCGIWVAAHRANDLQATSQDAWLGGYLTAYNLYGPGTGDVGRSTDMVGMIAWMTNYCSANPLVQIDLAADQLIKTLRSQR